METLAVVERVVHYYDGPWDLCKESDAQKQARQQQIDFNKQLMGIYKTQFSEQQGIFNALAPQLEAMAKSPEGFGATEYAALQASIMNNVGAQYSNVAKQAAREFATTNEAGLPSGVQAQLQSQIAASAAGQAAGENINLNVANEQLKQQQQQFALANLQGLSGQTGSFAGQTAGQEMGGIGQQFNQATQVYNQGSLWKNIASGLVGNAMNFLWPNTGAGSNFSFGGAQSGPLNPALFNSGTGMTDATIPGLLNSGGAIPGSIGGIPVLGG
jgi:hypothetical protein